MIELDSMPNIGVVLRERLIKVGITNSEQLISLGSKKAFLLLDKNGLDPCLSTLYALEGAVEYIRWHYLSSEKKKELKDFFDQMRTD